MYRKWIIGIISFTAAGALLGIGIAGASQTKENGSQTMGNRSMGMANCPRKTANCPMKMAGYAKVVRHIVAFKYKASASPEEIQKVNDAFANLKNEIPFILSYEAGTNISPENLNKGFTHCYILTFKNPKDRDAYLVHPAHKAFGKKLHPILEDVFVIDFETCPGACYGAKK